MGTSLTAGGALEGLRDRVGFPRLLVTGTPQLWSWTRPHSGTTLRHHFLGDLCGEGRPIHEIYLFCLIEAICKLWCIIEGDKQCGKKQGEEDWLPTGLWGGWTQEDFRWEDETWVDSEMMEVARRYIWECSQGRENRLCKSTNSSENLECWGCSQEAIVVGMYWARMSTAEDVQTQRGFTDENVGHFWSL